MNPTILKSAVLVAGLAALGLFAKPARADLTVTVQESGGTAQSFTTSGTPNASGVTAGSFTVNTADYSINVVSGTEIQNSLTELLSSTTSITNNTANNTGVLTITITGTGYTAPVAPPSINGFSQIGGSIVQTANNDTLSYQSAVNSSGFGLQSPTIGGQSNDSYSNTLNPPYSITSLSAPFTISETITILLTGQDDAVNYSSSTTLKQTPEPSTMAIAGLGALGMIGYGLRRRKAKGA